MSAVPKRRLTAQEYLAIERKAPFKSEFYRGEMFAMAGATFEHNIIKDNIVFELRSLLKDKSCRIMTSDMRVNIPRTSLYTYTYPDIVVYCGQPVFEDEQHDVLLNPKVIIEVLSESTEKYDRGTKFQLYQKLDSLEEYIMVAHNRAHIERYVRQPNDDWLLTNFDGLENELAVNSLKLSIPLRAIYDGITLSTEEPALED